MEIDEKTLAGLDAWKWNAGRVRASWVSLFPNPNEIRNSLGSSLDISRAFSDAERNARRAMVEFQQAVQKAIFDEQRRSWSELFKSIKMLHFGPLEWWRTPEGEQWQRDSDERLEKAPLILAEHEWFVYDMGMTIRFFCWLAENLQKGNVEEVEERLIEYFEERLDEIENSISEAFPHRAHLIRSAFSAHRRQEYELSIPVLLAQIDGICKEITGGEYFRTRNKKPRTSDYVEQMQGDGSFLDPLTRILPINASEGERPEGFNALNRHTVLHGESLDYGSKRNSLVAICFINSVVNLLGCGGKSA